MPHFVKMHGTATRLPRLDAKMSRSDVLATLEYLNVALPPKIAAAAKNGEPLGRLGFTVDVKSLDAAMAEANLDLKARINVKSALSSLGLLNEGRPFGASLSAR